MSRTILLAPGEFYHLYNRGTDKREIFSTEADRERFILLLYLCNSVEPVHLDTITKKQGSTSRELLFETDQKETLVNIHVYCLMPNHFHLLVYEKTEGGISKFMQKLTTGYTMYFNKRHERDGSLFQGKFKATHASEDRYLKYLISYIHLNPVKLIDPSWKENGIQNRATAQKFLREYPYSSYRDYLGENRVESKILNKETLPNYFQNVRDFETEIEDWLSYRKEEQEEL